jgi:hypothetical protein
MFGLICVLRNTIVLFGVCASKKEEDSVVKVTVLIYLGVKVGVLG